MLFLREIKKVVFSVTFLILVAAMLLFTVSQGVFSFSSEDKIEVPQQGQDYGTHTKETPEVIMPAALESLYNEFCFNNYNAYPIGFYKNVKLNDSKSQQMAEIISALTGISANELLKANGSMHGSNSYTFENDNGITIEGDGSHEITIQDSITHEENIASSITLREDISYSEFLGYMEKADKLIGGGSSYSDTYLLSNFSQIPITYEEASHSYNLIKDTDRFTGAYARLFCDYIVIVLSVLPVFLAVAVCLKDKRSGINESIYTRRTSSVRIISTRYLAIIVAVMLPTIILSYISNISIWNLYNGMMLDYFAPLKYCFGWVLPSVMVSSAVGMLLTELTNTPIAIAVQGLWWFIDMNLGIQSIKGGYPLFSLSPRHNSLQLTQVFIDNFSNLVANRLLFTGFALLLVVVTVLIYERKRRGKLNGYDKAKKTFADMEDSES